MLLLNVLVDISIKIRSTISLYPHLYIITYLFYEVLDVSHAVYLICTHIGVFDVPLK